jgi:hypothetical protein
LLTKELEKNPKERIRVTGEEFKGRKFVDCRVYWLDAQGEWKPGKKGIALAEETIDEVIEALQRAREELRTSQA